MSQQPIRGKMNQLASAPTPQNTPASLTGSYLKNNPIVPSTIDEEAEIKRNLSQNPAFLSMIQGKLGTLIGKDSGYINSLSPKIKNRIYSLKSVQADQMKLEEEFQKELLELEKKFFKKYEPLYKHRSEIINGDVEPTETEVETGKKIESELEGDDDEEDEEEEQEGQEQEENKDEEPPKGIPNFWLTALENLHPISETITDRDSEVLAFLKDVRLEYLSKPGFKLIFEFNENPFFTNKSLSKTYFYQEELGYSGDYIYDHAEGDVINWKNQESNVTISIERRKQRNKHTKQTRTIEKLTPTESFFNFFDPPKAPSDEDPKNTKNDDDEEDEEDEIEDDEDLEERLALDYQLGEEIKDKLIPRAVDWFTGSAVDYGLDDQEGFEDEEFDEDDDVESGSEDEDDDEDDESGSDGEGQSKGGKTKQQPPECKQS